VRDALRTLAAEGLIVSSGRSYRWSGSTSAPSTRCTPASRRSPATRAYGAPPRRPPRHGASAGRTTVAFARADVEFHSAFYGHAATTGGAGYGGGVGCFAAMNVRAAA